MDVDFSPEGTVLWVTDYGSPRSIQAIDAMSGDVIFEYAWPPLLCLESVFSPTSKYFLATHRDGRVIMFDVATGEIKWSTVFADVGDAYFSYDETDIGDATNATLGVYQNLGETVFVNITGSVSSNWFEFRIINSNGSYNPVGEATTYRVLHDRWAFPRVNIRVIDAPIPTGEYSINFTIEFPDGSSDNCKIPIEVLDKFESVWWYQPK